MIVKYSKKFPYAPYLNEDIGFEMEIPDGNDPFKALDYLKEMAEKFHNDNNPQLTECNYAYPPELIQTPTTGTTPHIQPMPSIDRKAIERLEILIDNAESISELQGYLIEAERLNIMDQYYIKFSQFVVGK